MLKKIVRMIYAKDFLLPSNYKFINHYTDATAAQQIVSCYKINKE